jgi:hypothetical protein
MPHVPIISKSIPLTTRLDVHIQPIVKDMLASWNVSDCVFAWLASKGRLNRKFDVPTTRVSTKLNKRFDDLLERDDVSIFGFFMGFTIWP